MNYLLLLSCLLYSILGIAQQENNLLSESEASQIELNKEYSNPETTILEPEIFKDFQGLSFYPLNADFIVEAVLVRTPNEKPFLMQTTTDRLPEYIKFGEVHFTIKAEQYVLNIFRSTQPYDEPGYEDYLFLPFTDLTSGDGSYGGGRYLDLRIPDDNILILDFNKAYNPYCAYNAKYSCPIPPKENDLPIRIEAGVKDFNLH